MFTDAALHMMRAAKANPTATALACTAVGFYTVRTHYMKKTLTHLEQSNRDLQAALKEKKDEVSQRLQLLEEAMKRDIAHRDAFLRKMELQNVEQTRSVDRLQHALRSCSVGGGVVASSSSSSAAAATAKPPIAAAAAAVVVPEIAPVAVPAPEAAAAAEPSLPAAAVVVEEVPAAVVPAAEPAAVAAPIAAVEVSAVAEANAPQNGDIVVVQEIDRIDQLRSRIVQQPAAEAAPIAAAEAAPAHEAVPQPLKDLMDTLSPAFAAQQQEQQQAASSNEGPAASN